MHDAADGVIGLVCDEHGRRLLDKTHHCRYVVIRDCTWVYLFDRSSIHYMSAGERLQLPAWYTAGTDMVKLSQWSPLQKFD